MVPGRLNDNFGIGWAQTELSSDFVLLLRQRLGLGLNRADAVERRFIDLK